MSVIASTLLTWDCMDLARLSDGIPRHGVIASRRLCRLEGSAHRLHGIRSAFVHTLAGERLHGRTPCVARSTSSDTVWDFRRYPNPVYPLFITHPAKDPRRRMKRCATR